jgi:hypothetical protein
MTLVKKIDSILVHIRNVFSNTQNNSNEFDLVRKLEQ